MTFEEELLSDLDYLIRAGDIVIDSASDKYFAQLSASFPTFGSKVDWELVPESIEETVGKDDYVESCFDFFRKICEEKGLSGKCILIGDSAIESALIMTIDVLNTCFKRILEVPQHHYIISEDYSWCMAFTIEGDMAFGIKKKTSIENN